LILNKILITRDIDFDGTEVLDRRVITEGGTTDIEVARSKVIIVINDDLSPVNIKIMK